MVLHDNCNGCDLPDDVEICDFFKDNFNGSCPCTCCLVKTMCNRACDDNYKWRKGTGVLKE